MPIPSSELFSRLYAHVMRQMYAEGSGRLQLTRLQELLNKKLHMELVAVCGEVKSDWTTWTLREFFTRPGIETATGIRYCGGSSNPETYGWCLGTDEDAAGRGLTISQQKPQAAKSSSATTRALLEVCFL